jgi:hypothetical protein
VDVNLSDRERIRVLEALRIEDQSDIHELTRDVEHRFDRVDTRLQAIDTRMWLVLMGLVTNVAVVLFEIITKGAR